MPGIDSIELARELIDIRSVTGEERSVAERLEAILESAGFQCRRDHVSDDRFNLLAAKGQPRILLSSHLDTVPRFFPSSEDELWVRGRGACDAKGIIAAMVGAAGDLLVNGRSDFGLLLVVGEETDSIGAKTANETFAGLGVEAVIVGEPTESRFVAASKGAYTATVGFAGTAAHSAYPERGDSAVLRMAEAIVEISRTAWGEHLLLGSGTANVGVVRGGEKANIIPGHAELEMILRTVEPPEVVDQRLAGVVERYGGTILRSHGNAPTFMTTPAHADPIVVSFNTDAPHLSALGRPILYGPGSILDAHGDGEKIAKREIITAREAYRQLVEGLLDRTLRLRDHASENRQGRD